MNNTTLPSCVEFFKVSGFLRGKQFVEAGFVTREAAESFADLMVIRHAKDVKIVCYRENQS